MHTALGTRVVIGLAIAAALGLADVVGIFAPPPDIGQAPPFATTLFIAVMGVLTLGAAGLVLLTAGEERGRTPGRIGIWVVVASRVASVLVAVPTSFVLGARASIVVWGVVVAVVTLAAVILLILGVVQEASARVR